MREMLEDCGLSQKTIDGVIARLSTNDPVNRKYDLMFTIAGRKMDFLVEIKSVNDLNVNVQQTVIEALYDSYMARELLSLRKRVRLSNVQLRCSLSPEMGIFTAKPRASRGGPRRAGASLGVPRAGALLAGCAFSAAVRSWWLARRVDPYPEAFEALLSG